MHDLEVATRGANQRGRERQLVVLYEDDLAVGCGLDNGARESCVHFDVARPGASWKR